MEAPNLKTKPSSHLKPLPHMLLALLLGAVAAVALCSAPSTARGQIFVGNTSSDSVSEYSVSGAPVVPLLFGGLHNPTGIAVSGSNVFVVNNSNGTVGKH